MRWRSAKGVENTIEHPRIVVGDLAVGETQNPESLFGQPCVAFGVADGIVEGAVGFHNQPDVKAEEVHDIRSDGNLSAELEPFQAPAAQQLPQEPLGVGL